MLSLLFFFGFKRKPLASLMLDLLFDNIGDCTTIWELVTCAAEPHRYACYRYSALIVFALRPMLSSSIQLNSQSVHFPESQTCQICKELNLLVDNWNMGDCLLSHHLSFVVCSCFIQPSICTATLNILKLKLRVCTVYSNWRTDTIRMIADHIKQHLKPYNAWLPVANPNKSRVV